MRWTRAKRSSWIGVGVGVALATGCGGESGTEPTDPDPTPTVASITVTLGEASIEAGTSTTVSAVARDGQGNPMQAAMTFSVDESSVATVSGGTVRARVPGTATITARSGSVSGSAQLEVRLRNVDALVEGVRQAAGVPAMAGALVTRDGIVAMGAAGTRRAGGATAVTLDDVWHIGSNLKAITALLAAVAVDGGHLEWTSTVEEAFPELDAEMRDEYRGVTLRDLLANAGGIRNDQPPSVWAGATAREQRESVIAWALGADPIGDVGDYYYSNPGFIVAGAMIERAMGGTYEELVSSALATPLGVDGIGWGPTTEAGETDQPVGHTRQGGDWVPCEACDNPPGLSAAGRAHMPIGTWARIVQEMMRAYDGSSSLVGAAVADELFEDQTPLPSSNDSYGLGWVMTQRPWGGRTATHSGSNTTNHSVAWLGLGNGVAMIAVTNAADPVGGTTGQALDALVGALLELHTGGG